jgi:hypothetical protein
VETGDSTTAVSRDRLYGHDVSPAMRDDAIMIETFCLCGPCRGYIMRISCHYGAEPRVEAGSKTSTVALRVIGADEKGTQCLGE